jgi:hypothetical protein
VQIAGTDGIVGRWRWGATGADRQSRRHPMSFDIFALLDAAALARRWRATNWRRWR